MYLTNANVETAANVEYVARGLIETVRETIISSTTHFNFKNMHFDS